MATKLKYMYVYILFIVCVVFVYVFTGEGVQVPETTAVWNMSGRNAPGIPFAPIWTHMCPHGPNMNPYGPKCVHMGTLGLIWAHMGPHGSIWAHGLEQTFFNLAKHFLTNIS